MNIKEIKALAEIMQANDLSLIEVEEGETCVRMERGPRVAVQPLAAANVAAAPALSPADSPAAKEEKDVQTAEESYRSVVRSPMVGVFYAAPAPGKPPFVEVGTKVKKGDVLCIIEAMKLLNDIVAEEDGTICEICVQNEQVVEYGQPLFKLN